MSHKTGTDQIWGLGHPHSARARYSAVGPDCSACCISPTNSHPGVRGAQTHPQQAADRHTGGYACQLCPCLLPVSGCPRTEVWAAQGIHKPFWKSPAKLEASQEYCPAQGPLSGEDRFGPKFCQAPDTSTATRKAGVLPGPTPAAQP